MSFQRENLAESSATSSSSDDEAIVQELILKLDKVINLLQQQRVCYIKGS